RHTRSKRDWSSDVCSSDLKRKHQRQKQKNRSTHGNPNTFCTKAHSQNAHQLPKQGKGKSRRDKQHQRIAQHLLNWELLSPHHARSEERRVGKEERAQRWTA